MALGLNRAVLGAGFDPDARAYLAALQANASGHANPQAVNKLVAGLKKAGLWTKLSDIALFVGVTNLAGCLVKLRTTTATPLLTSYNFVSGDFATNDGLKGNASKYLDTSYNPVTQGDSTSSLGLAVYVKEKIGTGTTQYIIGANSLSSANGTAIGKNNGGSYEYGGIASGVLADVGPGAVSQNGMLAISTNGSRVATYYNNGISQASGTESGVFANYSIYVNGVNYAATPSYQNARTIRMYAITTGLLATDHANFYTLIQAYMTTFGANV